MQDKKLEKIQKILDTVNVDYTTHEDVASVVKGIIGAIKDVKTELQKSIKDGDSTVNSKILGCISMMKDMEKSMKKALSDNTRTSLDTLRKELKKDVEKVQKLIPTLPEAFDPTELQNQIDVLMAFESPESKAITVRDLLETLQEEERLDASAIKNLPEATETIVHGMNKVLALYMLLDVDIAGITAGQTIQWDGNKWIAYTPAGSGGTPVWGEDLTTQGPGTSFTLAHTPLSGTVRLFRGGAYQSVANGDYSITGDTITLTVALATDEVLVVDYSY